MKLTKDIFAVRPGDVHPSTIAAGEDCPAELEEAARFFGALEDDDEPKASKAPANKALRAAPENKGE